MRLVLIDGGPASGKSTLGQILVSIFKREGENAVLLDLDTFVERYCPTWTWENEQQKGQDLSKAREDFAKEIDKSLADSLTVIAIGDRFMTEEEVIQYTGKLTKKIPVYLFHLNVPFELREQRLHARGPHSLIDLEQDQKDRDAVKEWPGYVYENALSPEEDARILFKLIQQDNGLIQN